MLRLQRRSSAIITARVQFDLFSWAKFLRGFRKEESQFPFTAYCLSIARLHQSPSKSSRFCVSSLRYRTSYVVIADNSCPPLSSFYHVLSLLQNHSNRMLTAILRFTRFMSVSNLPEIIEQTSVSHSVILFIYINSFVTSSRDKTYASKSMPIKLFSVKACFPIWKAG